jgi:hypothetical protein
MSTSMNDMHLVLHGLAIRKHADPAAVAAVAGLPAARVSELLQRAAVTGRAVEAQGAWLLSPAGRMILEGQYALVYAAERANPAFFQAYERFERINAELKSLVTDWQTIEVGGQKVRNDHADRDYDAKILDRLGALHDRFAPLLGELNRHVPRLGVYVRKLAAALEKAEDGALEWVSDARLDSYHTVWFELHEDLLRILGRTRDE